VADRRAEIEQVYAAVNARDIAALRRLLADGASIDTRGFFPDGDLYEGVDSIEAFLADIDERWRKIAWTIETIEVDGDNGHVDIQIEGSTAGKGMELKMPARHVWHWPRGGPLRISMERR
jgi:ketosteroid isomerase-like protein